MVEVAVFVLFLWGGWGLRDIVLVKYPRDFNFKRTKRYLPNLLSFQAPQGWLRPNHIFVFQTIHDWQPAGNILHVLMPCFVPNWPTMIHAATVLREWLVPLSRMKGPHHWCMSYCHLGLMSPLISKRVCDTLALLLSSSVRNNELDKDYSVRVVWTGLPDPSPYEQELPDPSPTTLVQNHASLIGDVFFQVTGFTLRNQDPSSDSVVKQHSNPLHPDPPDLRFKTPSKLVRNSDCKSRLKALTSRLIENSDPYFKSALIVALKTLRSRPTWLIPVWKHCLTQLKILIENLGQNPRRSILRHPFVRPGKNPDPDSESVWSSDWKQKLYHPITLDWSNPR